MTPRRAQTGPRPPKLTDVAARARVSTATASRVLNGSDRVVGGPHRTRVLAAAAELGYTVNAHAQAVARGSSNVLGLIVHDVTDPYFSAIADGVMRQCEQAGIVVMLAVTRRDPERELEYVSMLRAQRARAIILAGSRTLSGDHTLRLAKELDAYTGAGGSAACISQDRLGTHTVIALNRAGARDLATELHRLGHRRFAVLAGPRDLVTARDRQLGFLDGLTGCGVPRESVQVVHGEFTRTGGVQGAAVLLEAGLEATCLFAVNDVMAIGAMAVLRDAGVRIPDQVSVAGFDDIATLRDVSPRLSSVRLPLEEMGVHAARMALDTTLTSPRVLKVRGELLLRESTRPLT
jgi:LacI family transcriptional regulator